MTTEPKPWVHRKAGLIANQNLPNGKVCHYRREGRLVTEICCGDRYAHIEPGLIFMDELYVGSTSDNWHGGPRGSLTDIVRWLEDAEHLEYGFSLWMKEE